MHRVEFRECLSHMDLERLMGVGCLLADFQYVRSGRARHHLTELISIEEMAFIQVLGEAEVD